MTNLKNILFINNLERDKNFYSKNIEKGFLYSFTIGTTKDDGRLPLNKLTIKLNNTILDIYNEYNNFNTGNIEFKISDYDIDATNDKDEFIVQYEYNNNNNCDCYIILNILHNFNILGEKKKTDLINIKRIHIEKY